VCVERRIYHLRKIQLVDPSTREEMMLVGGEMLNGNRLVYNSYTYAGFRLGR